MDSVARTRDRRDHTPWPRRGGADQQEHFGLAVRDALLAVAAGHPRGRRRSPPTGQSRRTPCRRRCARSPRVAQSVSWEVGFADSALRGLDRLPLKIAQAVVEFATYRVLFSLDEEKETPSPSTAYAVDERTRRPRVRPMHSARAYDLDGGCGGLRSRRAARSPTPPPRAATPAPAPARRPGRPGVLGSRPRRRPPARSRPCPVPPTPPQRRAPRR